MTARQTLTWDHVLSTDGCFFFSGPEGRDDVLIGTAKIERDGNHIKMWIDRAEFDGTYREGRLDLMRISPHTFDGAWLTLERMHGAYDHGAMHVRYRYNECELAGACPGRCTIAGEITFTPEP